MPADNVANTYNGHTFGCSSEAFTAIASDISGEEHVRPDHEPPPLDAVGDRPTHDREHEHGDQLAQAQQAHRQGRLREVVHQERHRDRHDLIAQFGDRPPDEQPAEVLRHAHRREVHEVGAHASGQAWRDLRIGIGAEVIGHDGRPG